MQQHMVFTFISDDKPGIVELLSQTVSQAGGNWLESRLTKLAGKFAGFVQVSINTADSNKLQQQLSALQQQGIAVLIQNNIDADSQDSAQNIKLTIIGLDRPGIVKELATAFVSHHLNVINMHSYTESAAMSGGELFKAEVDLSMHADSEPDKFTDEIEALCDELDLDYTLTDI
ncbi:MAG: glycine cleavage system protein R [Pseudomonadales bacterium]|nr:glycine cleavage system protein R [Pseudomonadales bacterium]